MSDDLIERMVEAGKAAVWDLSLSGDAKGAKAVTKTTRACLAAALRAWEPDEDDADSAAQDFDLRGPYTIEVVARIAREMSRDLAYKLDKAND